MGVASDSNIPSMNANPVSNVHGLLTPNSGGHQDVVSPGSSTPGVNSAVSQYSHGSSWAGQGNNSNSFGFGSISSTTSHNSYDHKPSSFDSASSTPSYQLYQQRPSPAASTGHNDSLTTSTYGTQGQAQGHGHAQHQQQQYNSLFNHSSATASSPGGLLGGTSSTQPPTPSSATVPHDPYSRQPTHNYFSTASTPQSSYGPFSPTGASPHTTAGGPSRGLLSHSGMAPPPSAYRNYPQIGQPMQHIPSMHGGPIMTNLSNPGGQMSVMPGMPVPGYTPHHLTQNIYGNAVPQQERPYKCGQCPQSFNRNHDLKRHTRIHLSVKPFPCGTCEKAFSRKDALKVSFVPLTPARLWTLTDMYHRGTDSSRDAVIPSTPRPVATTARAVATPATPCPPP